MDGFQGREKSVILFSCVRSSRRIGFLSDERRLNVALTRAKHALVLIGSAVPLSTEGNAVWSSLVASLRERGAVHRVRAYDSAVLDKVLVKKDAAAENNGSRH